MSAVILAFPRPSPIRALCRPADGSALFTPAWCAQHLPLIDAAMELLEADDVKFTRRCQAMRDEEGRAMLDDWPGSCRGFGAHIADVAGALSLAAARILDEMTA